MNRRGFLGLLLGLALAPFAAKFPFFKSDALTVSDIKVAWKAFYETKSLNDAWYCVVHPSVEADIRLMIAKDRWRDAYRQARVAGERDIKSDQILAKYGQINSIGD